MENISLIANSGIQFYRSEIKINPNEDVIKTMGFCETLMQNHTIFVKPAYYLPDVDFWVEKDVLQHFNFLDENENLILEGINYNQLKTVAIKDEGLQADGKSYFHSFGDISDALKCYSSQENENLWIPIPYFKKIGNKCNFGPIAWARAIFKDITQKGDKIKTYQVVIAFDTKIDHHNKHYFTPKKEDTYEGDNYFMLCDDENYNLQFCDSQYHCDWVQSYIKKIYLKREEKDDPDNFPYFKHIAAYQYLIKYLAVKKIFPQVVFYSDEAVTIDVDLILDIGNSDTCGLLFESPLKNSDTFNFKSVKKLDLQDLSDPFKKYDEPFSMRLAFAKAEFGEIFIEGHKNFKWPSLLRLGKEANRLITTYNLDIDKGKETATHHSSPKRYLWDTKMSDIQWEFVNSNGKESKESISFEGISEQFKSNGEYAYDGVSGVSPFYSKKSLMTFVYIEIFLQAIAQINSHNFRSIHGNIEKPRKLKRVTITCPTSIIQYEQVTLRKCALEATRTLSRFFSESFLGSYESDDESAELIEVIPNPKDLSKKLNMIKERKDWIYDEATCGQLVFLYAEIAERYLSNANLFFNIYGKKRDDVDDPNRNSLTIGSIDIGGGTTDLMICAYQYEEGQSLAVLKPHPLYWESFDLAGDDLIKNIVQQIILEGKPNTENFDDTGCCGVIENAARKQGVVNVAEKMLNFFGTDTNRQDYMARIFRKNFIVQVAVPIAIEYLKHAINPLSIDKEVGFDELFTDNKPNVELITYFNQKFAPLKFEDIRWKLSKHKVFSIVENTFDALLKQLSAILSAYGCDFVLLAGKPTTIPKIREMFVKYYPVSPEKIITLNEYRVGRWYPFANDLGYFEDSKTMVSVGACIALMGGTIDKLSGFRIKTDLLKRNLISTSDYIGIIDEYTQKITTVFLTPDENTFEIEVHSLPILLGYKQLPNSGYRARPIYKLQFNDEYFREKVIEQNSHIETNEREVYNLIAQQQRNLKNRMPFKVQFKRNWSESKEQVNIERIKDEARNEISKKTLNLQVITLTDENGYWLDSGEFVLNIK